MHGVQQHMLHGFEFQAKSYMSRVCHTTRSMVYVPGHHPACMAHNTCTTHNRLAYNELLQIDVLANYHLTKCNMALAGGMLL